LGDLCTGGLCTPARFTSLAASSQPDPERSERWEDPNLDVWNTPNRHFVYSGYAASNLADEGVFEAPQYIVEFMGNYRSFEPTERFTDGRFTIRPKYDFDSEVSTNCGNQNSELNLVWPYCAADPSVFRITVRATAGVSSRQSVVFLQSTIVTP